MIENLTAEQIARFPEFINKWIKIGLSTEPADRPRAEAAIRLMYKNAGLTPPEKIVWFDSPCSALFNRAVLTDWQKGKQVWDLIYHSAVERTDIDTSKKIDVQTRLLVDRLMIKLCPVHAIVMNVVDWMLWSTISGSNDAPWLLVKDYFREVLGLVEETEKLISYFEMAKSCGWVIPHEKICLVSERPSVLKTDYLGKLHCENGPAISYPDGWSIYADHGVAVSERVVMNPGGFTLKELKKLKMPEVKVVLRKIGVEKFMAIKGTRRNSWTKLFNEIAKETIND